MDSDIQISSGSSSSSSSVSSSGNCSDSGSDDYVSKPIGKETSGGILSLLLSFVHFLMRLGLWSNSTPGAVFFFHSGSGSFTSSAGNSQDNAGCTNHASPSGAPSYTSRPQDTTRNGVRILPPSSNTNGTSASPLHDPSDPVDMTGTGEDENSERLIYQDALRVLIINSLFS